MINALTPPVIKRGAVLIDPSYEELSDYENVVKTFKILNKKWNVGIFCLWYPLLAYKKNIIDEIKIVKSKLHNRSVTFNIPLILIFPIIAHFSAFFN